MGSRFITNRVGVILPVKDGSFPSGCLRNCNQGLSLFSHSSALEPAGPKRALFAATAVAHDATLPPVAARKPSMRPIIPELRCSPGGFGMADNSVVRARIDERTKREAADVLNAIGLTLSDAFRMLLIWVAAENAAPVRAACAQCRNHQGHARLRAEVSSPRSAIRRS